MASKPPGWSGRDLVVRVHTISPGARGAIRRNTYRVRGFPSDPCARRGGDSAGNGDLVGRDPARALQPRVDAELVEDAREVALDGPFGDEQTAGDLGVGRTLGDERGDLHFPA